MSGVAVGVGFKIRGEDQLWDSIHDLQALDGGSSRVQVEVQYAQIGGATPAASLFAGAVRAVFGNLPLGITAVRKIAGTDEWSQHAYSNAVDVMCTGELHRKVAYWADANRGVFDIAHLLADPYFPSPLGDHYNHVHADFYPQWCGTPPGHPC